jgi:hypothetical protein
LPYQIFNQIKCLKKKIECVVSLRRSKKDHSDLNEIANRIRYLRMLTGLDRPSMERRHDIKKVSLEKWENGTANISQRNISRLVSVALDHSIECTPEWLLLGKGAPPKTIPPSSINTQQVGKGDAAEDTLRDLSYFRNTYPKGVTLMVCDEAMAPYYANGDFVAGNTIDLKNLRKYLDCACIVETADGKKRARRVGYSDGAWFLYGTNPKHTGSAFLEIHVEITLVAPIFWHRMKLDIKG